MAILPPFFLNTVAAIGTYDEQSKPRWIGTGFLFGKFIKVNSDKSKSYRVYLVTNKHVFIDHKKIILKFNSASSLDCRDYPVELTDKGAPIWTGHSEEDKDVAVMLINLNLLKSEDRLVSYFQSDEHISTKMDLKKNEIQEGENIYVLGFPLSLVNPSRMYTICRGGVIARIRDCLDGKSPDYLIDASIFPGNSGGPVILGGSSACIEGTKKLASPI